jgi:hypothetical protein
MICRLDGGGVERQDGERRKLPPLPGCRGGDVSWGWKRDTFGVRDDEISKECGKTEVDLDFEGPKVQSMLIKRRIRDEI